MPASFIEWEACSICLPIVCGALMSPHSLLGVCELCHDDALATHRMHWQFVGCMFFPDVFPHSASATPESLQSNKIHALDYVMLLFYAELGASATCLLGFERQIVSFRLRGAMSPQASTSRISTASNNFSLDVSSHPFAAEQFLATRVSSFSRFQRQKGTSQFLSCSLSKMS